MLNNLLLTPFNDFGSSHRADFNHKASIDSLVHNVGDTVEEGLHGLNPIPIVGEMTEGAGKTLSSVVDHFKDGDLPLNPVEDAMDMIDNTVYKIFLNEPEDKGNSERNRQTLGPTIDWKLIYNLDDKEKDNLLIGSSALKDRIDFLTDLNSRLLDSIQNVKNLANKFKNEIEELTHCLLGPYPKAREIMLSRPKVVMRTDNIPIKEIINNSYSSFGEFNFDEMDRRKENLSNKLNKLPQNMITKAQQFDNLINKLPTQKTY